MGPSLIGSLIISLLLAQAQLERLAPTLVYAATITPREIVAPNLVALASSTAEKYHLNTEHFLKVINCESGFNPNIRGDNGLARGIAQIRSDYHPDISDAQADDPRWALNWMAQEWAADRAYEWRCWKIYYR